MKKKMVITNIPVRLPIQSTILYSFLLYYFHASGLIWGIFGTLYLIFWILVLITKFSEERINLDEEDKPDSPGKNISTKSKFQQRLIDLASKRNNTN